MSVIPFKKSESSKLLVEELETLLKAAKAGTLTHCAILTEVDGEEAMIFTFHPWEPAELNFMLDCLKFDLVLGLE